MTGSYLRQTSWLTCSDAPDDLTPVSHSQNLQARFLAAVAAPKSPVRNPVVSPAKIVNPSPARSGPQARLIGLLDEAVMSKAAIESMDFEGIVGMMAQLEELKSAVTGNLKKRAEAERLARRAA
jgi:hypothetical protein